MITIMKILKITLIIVATLIVLFLSFLGFMTITEYQPDAIEKIEVLGKPAEIQLKDTLTFVTWNIGYGGLGKEQDFFFDGGKGVRPTTELSQKYLKGIIKTIQSFSNDDFILLQEVDRDSRRSYYIDQVTSIANDMPGFAYSFAKNYHSLFVPQPVSNPYGRAVGGLMSLSKYAPTIAQRHALAADASWPTGIFMLKRCFMEWRYPMLNGKELIVINQHLSAYDDGSVKQQQMDTLKKYLLNEYAKGNYIVVGGDWNQFPPGYVPQLKGPENVVAMNVDKEYPATGWNWSYDTVVNTNRKLNVPYVKGINDEVVIDYFLCSPNIRVIDVKGVQLNFENSDHQPVRLSIFLKNN
jgi:endonuclease/exonuclease/phosphatase family metal-dependent hydrolase